MEDYSEAEAIARISFAIGNAYIGYKAAQYLLHRRKKKKKRK